MRGKIHLYRFSTGKAVCGFIAHVTLRTYRSKHATCKRCLRRALSASAGANNED